MLEEQKPTGLGAWSNELAREQPDERRDIQRTINLWRRHVTDDGLPPLLSTFDFSAMKGDWGHRFLICSDPSIENAAFVIYGIKFSDQRLSTSRSSALIGGSSIGVSMTAATSGANFWNKTSGIPRRAP